MIKPFLIPTERARELLNATPHMFRALRAAGLVAPPMRGTRLYSHVDIRRAARLMARIRTETAPRKPLR